MFQGFTDRTFEFFMAIGFNNNREFFQANHAWYVDAVREPARALVADLNDVVRGVDPSLETRPQKVVSRINRDIRFSNDKSPYRDYIWLAFRRPGSERKSTLGLFFDMSAEGASFGMGFYDRNMPMMNALRRRILTEPEALTALTAPVLARYRLYPREMKRLQIPDQVPEPLRPWYRLRGFYVEREIRDFSLLKSPRLADALAEGFLELKPLYQYLLAMPPEEEFVDFSKATL